MGRIIVITGTNTGVGKSVFTGMALHYLRENGCNALAMKPFCTGGKGDVELIQGLLAGELTAQEINPYYSAAPLAPLLSGRMEGQRVRLQQVIAKIKGLAARCEVLLIEGAGGLLTPLGEGFSLQNIISELKTEVIIVAPNQLGVINQVLLTHQAVPKWSQKRAVTILMGQKNEDFSSATNPELLREMVPQMPVITVDYLGRSASQVKALKNMCKKNKKPLVLWRETANLSSFFDGSCDENAAEKKVRKS